MFIIMYLCYYLYSLTNFFLLFTDVLSDVIRVRQGLIQNERVLKARNGVLFKAYYSIPFAEPPIGRLRFQPPLQAKQWNGILNTSNESPPCMQNLYGRGKVVGSEDCLYLNVFTPLKAKKGDNYPVIVYIFGGVFIYGASSVFKPHYFMQKKVILVQFNYRLGTLGFLSTGDEVISGNFGLKDQTMALNWTKENIKEFGGDPNQITLFGHSSGAMCAHFHTLSPLSRGLFNKVIIQSGSATNPVAYYGTDAAKKIIKKLSGFVGCKFNRSEKILQCLLELSPSVIVMQLPKLRFRDLLLPFVILKPLIESKKVENAFLNELPNNLTYISTNQSWLIGLTTGEGAFLIKEFFYRQNYSKEIIENSSLIFPILFDYCWNPVQNQVDYITKKIMSEYFEDKKININPVKLVDLASDFIYGWSFIDMIKKYKGTKYIYLYDHISNYSIQNTINGIYYGVDHADELHLIFETEESLKYLNSTDIILGDEMITRWVNFVYSGNPNIPFHINETILSYWEPSTSTRIEYLRIKIHGSMESNIMYKRRYKFYKSLSAVDIRYK